jgi:DNA-binding response OmpR family regulator
MNLAADPVEENPKRKMVNQGKILIIDDDDNLRATLGLVLKRSGYEVIEAENALAALACLQVQAFDMAFLDLRMPGMDGSALLVKLRAAYPDMPVIILTAYASLESSQHAVKHGARDYLVKPVSPANILERVKEYLSEAPQDGNSDALVPEAIQAVTDSFPPRFVHQNERFTKAGDALLDRQLNTITVQGRVIDLATIDVGYLFALMRQAPEAISYEALVLEAQGLQLESGEARDLARWHVQGLREVLEEKPKHASRIVSIKDFGYRFIPTGNEREPDEGGKLHRDA